MRGNHGLDFAELDAVAADLHLVVEPTEILDVAAGAIARAVARLVQATAARGAERIGHEALRRQIGTPQVAATDAVAADEDLARDADGNPLEVRVEDVHLKIRDRPADEDRSEVAIAGRFLVHAATDDRFRRAVLVDQARARRPRAPEFEGRAVQRLAADDERVDVSGEIDAGELMFEDFQVRRRQLEQAERVGLA